MMRLSLFALCCLALSVAPARAADAPAAAAPQTAAPAAAPAAPASGNAPQPAAKSAAPPKSAAPAKSAPSTKSAAAAPPRPVAPGHLFETIRKRGTLLVGTSWTIPWSMRDPEGQWQGFEIDLARQLAADLGVEVTFVRVPFRDITSALASGRVDIVASGYSITPQRALVVDFSNPYADSQMELVVRKDLAQADVNRSDVKLGVRSATTSEATAYSRFPNAKVMAYPTTRDLYEAARNGEIDGVLAYTPRTTLAVAQSEGKLAVATGITALPHTVEGFAVRKGEQGLLNYLNAWIEYWRADGWISERHRYWFDSLDWTTRFAPPGDAAGPAK